MVERFSRAYCWSSIRPEASNLAGTEVGHALGFRRAVNARPEGFHYWSGFSPYQLDLAPHLDEDLEHLRGSACLVAHYLTDVLGGLTIGVFVDHIVRRVRPLRILK
jgi:hypothetical protein